MDLLRHGAGVEVLAPPGLRARVAGELEAAARQYK
jgi:predicted DNA-binding transcriptional regulator YafY